MKSILVIAFLVSFYSSAFHKSANENNKIQLDGLKKSASIQTSASAKQNAKLRI